MPAVTVQQAYELAVRQQQAGQLREAETIYHQIIARQPDHAHAHYMLSVMGHQVRRSSEALPLIDKAIGLRPDLPDFHMFRGVLLAATGQFLEAANAFRRVTVLRPDDAEAYNNIGNALREVEQLDEAIAAYQRALELRPDFPQVYGNMSAALKDRGRTDDAIAAARKAISLRPNYPGALTNLGNALKDKGKFDEAMDAYRQAVALQPSYADGYYNLGNLHKEKGELDDASAAYEHALLLRPDFHSAKWNLSLTKLLRGDDDAWDAYEARWGVYKRPMNRGFAQALWDGSDLSGRRILMHAEQGLGDTIQFVRYAALIKAHHPSTAGVVLLCSPELKRLLTGQLGIEQVVCDENSLPPFDVHCPLLSLPRIFRTTTQTVPVSVPYLLPEPALVEQRRRRIAAEPFGLKVGLVWAGRAISPHDAKRSIALASLAPLPLGADVRFYSLQKGEAASQANSPPPGMQLTDWTSELNDFADTAALIANLDLVISVDTAVAHLAGALAKPVWMLIPFAPDWRWMLGRDDSPWYPTMRLFRQQRWGDWEGAMNAIAEALVMLNAEFKAGSD